MYPYPGALPQAAGCTSQGGNQVPGPLVTEKEPLTLGARLLEIGLGSQESDHTIQSVSVEQKVLLLHTGTWPCQIKQASTPRRHPTGFLFLIQRGQNVVSHSY